MPSEAELIGKQQIQNTLDLLGTTYNGWLIKKLSIARVTATNVEVSTDGCLKPAKGKARATVEIHLDVTEEMCNPGGSMHGGCTGFLLDTVSSMPLMIVTDGTAWGTTGVSVNYNVSFLQGIPCGAKIKIISSLLSLGARMSVLDCQFLDRDSGKLYAVGSHTKADTYRPPSSKL